MKDSYTDEQVLSHVNIVLKNGMFCHLGMSKDNMPYTVTVNFGFDDDFIYFHSSRKGKKVDILKVNPNICFEINYGGEIYSNKNACNWGTKFRSIIGTGKVELLENETDKIHALKAIMHKYSGTYNHEFNENVVSHTNIYRIKRDNVTARQNKMYWSDGVME